MLNIGKAQSLKQYKPLISANINRKGVLDIDTVKGCTEGMKRYPNGGCYGLCYAAKIAKVYGYDFTKSVSREAFNINKLQLNLFNNLKTGGVREVYNTVKNHKMSWFRIGTMGDPSHDWELTLSVCEWLGRIRTPVVITKHWLEIPDYMYSMFLKSGVVFNTSISPLDSDFEIKHRLIQFKKLKQYGIRSILRIVSCRFGGTKKGKELNKKQEQLFCNTQIIDNPLRIPNTDKRVLNGDIITEKTKDLNSENWISRFNKKTYIGKCSSCPDQCGVLLKNRRAKMKQKVIEKEQVQLELFGVDVEYIQIDSVIGSGYEVEVADLAIRDKVAYRAARKNMQIHSAIILKINNVFSGFMTYQVNHIAKEFCLLQSAMELDRKDKEIYSGMVEKIIEQNTYGYPMVMTVSTKHDLENPKVFEKMGFVTYLSLSGFAYMVYGTLEQVRMKRLAHATMTNVWTTTRSDWLKMKREWNGKIEDAGEKHNIENPKFASRDGCWQGKNGYSNVVLSSQSVENGKIKHKKGKSFNGNASVLDPLACEVILRFFMPTKGKRVYNPFGGGVQFGFVTGSYGYEYIASEIRQNQCDANNILCSDLDSATWIKSDSSTYSPDGMFDLVFSCPPYYKVEKYIDYGGVIPDGELNNIPTYEEFRNTLFSGYKKAIEKLNDNCFFVVMTGDSRGKDGSYYGCESEHELFFKEQGLSLYNKIVYLECEFTRLAHAKRTLDYRKFPKREQKIIVAYKGDMKKIKDNYPAIGRL